MTPERFRECLDITGISSRRLADMLGRHDRNIRRWSGGSLPVPSHVAQWLDGLAEYMKANPPPPVGGANDTRAS